MSGGMSRGLKGVTQIAAPDFSSGRGVKRPAAPRQLLYRDPAAGI